MSTPQQIFTFKCKQTIGGDINERKVRLVLGHEDFFLYDTLDSPLENWPYSKVQNVERQKNILSTDSVIIDLGSFYYKRIHIITPQAQEAVQLFQDIFDYLSDPRKKGPVLHTGEYKVIEGTQRYKFYEDIDVKIDLSEQCFKCWRIFPNVPTEVDESKDLLHEFKFQSLARWTSTIEDKVLLTFNVLLGERTVIITTKEVKGVVGAISQIFHCISSRQ